MAHPHPFGSSVTAVYGKRLTTSRQYELVARIWNGEDVRFWQVNHTVAHNLIDKGVLDCEAATCRLFLLPPPRADKANAVRGATA